MNAEDYKKELGIINAEAESKKFRLAKKYALSHNTIKKGDVVKSVDKSIAVKNILIAVSASNGLPCCVYKGEALTKAGKPFKNPRIRTIWQSDIITT